tara:strand:- start:171 stop:437 length:267 start_codon:yes stop_codon:yes gene_type:complete
MLSTDGGMAKLARLEQPEKALSGMLGRRMPSAMFTLIKFAQPENAPLPMETSDCGRDISATREHPEKALAPILTKEVLMPTVVRLSQA